MEKVAAHMEVELSETDLAHVVELSSFQWMSAHDDKFDDHWMFTKIGMPEKISSKVGLNNESLSCVLSEESLAYLRAEWAEVVEPQTGVESYEAMRNALRAGL